MYHNESSACKYRYNNNNKKNYKEITKCDLYTGKQTGKQALETFYKEGQIVCLTDIDFKALMLNISKELKETISKK